MSADVFARVQKLKRDGTVPANASYSILCSGLTHEEATAEEAARRTECGPFCEGRLGGAYKAGNVWSVYRIDW